MGIVTEIFPAIKTLLGAPFQEPSLLWQVAPLLFLWILLEIYFGLYKREKLGWNSALANGISMFWIVLSGLQFAFSSQDSLRLNWGVILVLFGIAAYAIFVVIISFKHRFNSELTFFLASPTPMFYLSIIALIVAHQLIPLTWAILIAVIIMLIFFEVFFLIVRKLIPAKKGVQDEFEEDWKQKDSFEDRFSFPEHEQSQPKPVESPESFLDEKKPLGGLEKGVEKMATKQDNDFLRKI